MTKIRIAIVALMVSTLFVSACGRRGPLEAPPDLEKQDKQDNNFVLDPLI